MWYPACLSMASLSLSLSSRPMWLRSSSSITATTFMWLLHKTKSTTFRLKRFRDCQPSAVISAENATCVSTMHSGSAVVRRENICCSRFVSIGLRFICSDSGDLAETSLNIPGLKSFENISAVIATESNNISVFIKWPLVLDGNKHITVVLNRSSGRLTQRKRS